MLIKVIKIIHQINMSRKKDYQDAKDKIDAYKTVRDLKKQEARKKKQDALENYNQKKRRF